MNNFIIEFQNIGYEDVPTHLVEQRLKLIALESAGIKGILYWDPKVNKLMVGMPKKLKKGE